MMRADLKYGFIRNVGNVNEIFWRYCVALE